jgi:tetratricopeptide (TPR) repeat protein
MHDELAEAVNSNKWKADGTIHIPISNRSLAGIQPQANRHIVTYGGRSYIVFSWLNQDELEALGYLASADSSAYKNGADGGKAEKFANEGLKLVREWTKPNLSGGCRQYQKLTVFQKLLEAEFLLLLSYLNCAKGQWRVANEFLDQAATIYDNVGDALPINKRYAVMYLRGVILQGTGDLVGALDIYQSPLLSLEGNQRSSTTATSKITSSHFADSDVTHNFCILAAMNSAFIMQSPNHPQHNRVPSLMKSLDAVVQSCGNKYIQAHFSFMVSALSGTTLTLKHYLKSAMEAGKAIGSAQTTALALIFMSERLFKGNVEEQALKCAKASSAQTRRWGDPMWLHVTAGLEAQSLEVNGYEEEGRKKMVDAEAAWEALPERVKTATS